jgi:hypothetical protein
MAEELPTRWPADIHDLPEAGAPELEQRLAGGNVMAGDEGDRGNAGKIVHQATHLPHRFGGTAVNGEEDPVHRPLPDGPDRLGDAVAVEEGEATLPGRFHLQPLRREEYGRDGRLSALCHGE